MKYITLTTKDNSEHLIFVDKIVDIYTTARSETIVTLINGQELIAVHNTKTIKESIRTAESL